MYGSCSEAAEIPSKKSKICPAIGYTKAERIGQLDSLVVVQNRGKSPNTIQIALWNLLDHLIEKHDNCPQTLDSWCYYKRGLAENQEDDAIPIPFIRQPYILLIQRFSHAHEVFQTFASDSMCSAVTMGMTQNSNESLHSIIWHNSPKTKYMGQKSLEASTSLAVSSFNEGNMALASVLSHRIRRKRKIDDWVGCDIYDEWFHGRCVGIKDVEALGDDPYFCAACDIDIS